MKPLAARLENHIERSGCCDLCGVVVTEHNRVATGMQDLLGQSVRLSTAMCPRCGFMFQPERFSEELLSELYREDTSFAFEASPEDAAAVQAGLTERQQVISGAMARHGLDRGASVLDIGGGRGECCRHLVERHHVVVADTTDCAPADPRIQKVHGLFSADLLADTFDVVVMNHILEHVFSPSTILASARRLLRDNGLLIVEVPFELYTPLLRRHLGDWRHVGYFSRATLRAFVEKAGFLVERLELEEGPYGSRRLLVIRAVARKATVLATPTIPPRRSLARDLFAPIALKSLVQRIVWQR